MCGPASQARVKEKHSRQYEESSGSPLVSVPYSPSDYHRGFLLLGCRPRSRLDLLKPHTPEQVEKKQSAQKEQHDWRSKERKLEVGTTVFVQNYHQGARWLPGVIKQKTGPVSFLVKLQDGRIRCCHQDQVSGCSVSVPQESTMESDMDIVAAEPSESPPTYSEPSAPTLESTMGASVSSEEATQLTDTTIEPVATDLAKGLCSRHLVDRYKPGW